MSGIAIPLADETRATVAQMRNDGPKVRAEDAGRFQLSLLDALTPAQWARGLAVPSASDGPRPVGRERPRDTGDPAGHSDEGANPTADHSERLARAIPADPTSLAASLLVSPVSEGKSELASASAESATERERGSSGAGAAESTRRRELSPLPSDRAGSDDNARGKDPGTPQAPPSATPPTAQNSDPARDQSQQPSDRDTSAKPIAAAAPGVRRDGSTVIAEAGRSLIAPSPRSAEGQLRALAGPAVGSFTRAGRPTAGPTPSIGERHGSSGAMRAEQETFAGQIGRGLASVLRQKGGSVTLRLNPESLGQVRVSVTLEDSRVSARFEAATEGARRLLADNADSLRQALEGRGLAVDQLHIVGPDPSDRADPGATTTGDRPSQGDPGTTTFSPGPDGRNTQDQATGDDALARQAAGGGPWGTQTRDIDRAPEAPDAYPAQGPVAAYVGLPDGTLWLRVDAIA